jgi:UDP-2,3-diacylglucosamine hydrolase
VSRPVYFLSDAHLGGESPAREGPKERSLVAFLDARLPGETVYILGDLFDFWFDDGEPPARHAAVLRSLGRLIERGVRCLLMGGNHDYWLRTGRGPGWLERELGVEIVDDPYVAEHHGRRLLLAHGDALDGARGSYGALRYLLRHPLATFGFGLLPRRFQHGLGALASSTSRRRVTAELIEVVAAELRATATRILAERDVDAVIAGHVHRPQLVSTPGGEYLNIGDWMFYRTYGALRDGVLSLESSDGGSPLKPIPR